MYVHVYNMGRKPGVKTVDIEPELYQLITDKTEKTNISIKQFINDIIKANFEKYEFLKMVAPKVSFISIESDVLLLKDEHVKKSRLVEIKIKNGKLYCNLDESQNCEHIHYALTLSELLQFKDKIKQI